MVLHTYSWYSFTSPKFNSDSKRKGYEEEEIDYVEGRFQEDIDDKDEFINLW